MWRRSVLTSAAPGAFSCVCLIIFGIFLTRFEALRKDISVGDDSTFKLHCFSMADYHGVFRIFSMFSVSFRDSSVLIVREIHLSLTEMYCYELRSHMPFPRTANSLDVPMDMWVCRFQTLILCGLLTTPRHISSWLLSLSRLSAHYYSLLGFVALRFKCV
jgi:hypothetical protein